MGETKIAEKYLVRAELQFDWEYKKKGDAEQPLVPHRLPVTLGPFKLDQSPNFEFHLADHLGTEHVREVDGAYPFSLLFFEIEVEVPERRDVEARADETLGHVEILLRLFQPGYIYVRRHLFVGAIKEGKPKFSLPLSFSLYWGSPPIKPKPESLYGRSPYRFDDAVLARFIEFFNDYWPIMQQKQPRLVTALHRFSSSYERRTLADRLTELVIALEALFGDDDVDSVTYKVALRCASWLYPPSEARAKAFKTLREIYSDRSKILHGRELAPKHSNEEIELFEDYLRQAMKKFLSQFKNGNVTFKKGKMLISNKTMDELLFFSKELS